MQRMLQGIEHEICARRAGDTLTDDTPGEHFDDEGYIDETLPRADVGEVRYPRRSRPLRAELQVHSVQGLAPALSLTVVSGLPRTTPCRPMCCISRSTRAIALASYRDSVGAPRGAILPILELIHRHRGCYMIALNHVATQLVKTIPHPLTFDAFCHHFKLQSVP